jgi:hypothetical protein
VEFASLAAQYFDPTMRWTVAISLIVSAPAFVVMRLYMRTITRESQRTATAARIDLDAQRLERPPSAAVPALDIGVETFASDAHAPPRSRTFRHAQQAFRRAAACYVLAGAAHAAVSTVLLFVFGFYARPAASSALTLLACYVAVFWAWLFATILALALFYGPDRRFRVTLVAVYIAALPLMGICLTLAGAPKLPFTDVRMIDPDLGAVMLSFAHTVTGENVTPETVSFSPLTQPTFFYTLAAAPFVIPVLAFNRFVRGTLGPVCITFAMLATLGVLIGFDLLVFVTRALPMKGILGPHPLSLIVPFTVVVACIAAAVVLLWIVRGYRRIQLSDQTFLFDALWLSVSLCVTVYLSGNVPRLVYLLGLLPFALYKLVMWYGFRRFVAPREPLPNARLLFLRVFGSPRRSERLFDLLAARWRYAGSIQLISGTDIARSRFEPDEFLDFIAGRFRNCYISRVEDIEQRIAQISNRPDPDGRYRVHEFFCRADMWQPTVVRLMALSELVAMDLRGFTAGRRGCAFELAALMDNVPVERVVLLVDRTTDVQFLRDMLDRLWKTMAPDSPNAKTSAASLKIIDLDRGYPRAVRRLMHMGDEVPVGSGAAA